ncbi:4-hydroxy-tetrahydrodipicolinate reductase [Mucilaginibacter sp. PAMB04274]|uniref:4-hydroxy-tetrahydrodipicolinate reductase n=1 Tax=Mucilaginibacter sp. PAMB04274 TaxID=3138568 RepID=UPI0031F6984F
MKVLVAGGTGWAGSELSKAIVQHPSLELVGAISRSQAGKNLAELLGIEGSLPIYDNINSAIAGADFDIMVDYTSPAVAMSNIILALRSHKKVVIGTSGLSESDYAEIEKVAIDFETSVLAVGNFAITVVLLQKFAEIAARYISTYEIIDYAHQDKIDAPSGTARELAYKLSMIQKPISEQLKHGFLGEKDSRGTNLNGIQVHSVRLPGHVISIETIFGLEDEKLIIRHDAGKSAKPYVKGALIAIENISSFKGLRRGLDTVLNLEI